MQRRGVPDIMVIMGGHVIFFEVKLPNKDLSPIQLHVMNDLRYHGAKVAKVTSKAEVIESLEDWGLLD
jgi:hypothetical protein